MVFTLYITRFTGPLRSSFLLLKEMYISFQSVLSPPADPVISANLHRLASIVTSTKTRVDPPSMAAVTWRTRAQRPTGTTCSPCVILPKKKRYDLVPPHKETLACLVLHSCSLPLSIYLLSHSGFFLQDHNTLIGGYSGSIAGNTQWRLTIPEQHHVLLMLSTGKYSYSANPSFFVTP